MRDSTVLYVNQIDECQATTAYMIIHSWKQKSVVTCLLFFTWVSVKVMKQYESNTAFNQTSNFIPSPIRTKSIVSLSKWILWRWLFLIFHYQPNTATKDHSRAASDFLPRTFSERGNKIYYHVNSLLFWAKILGGSLSEEGVSLPPPCGRNPVIVLLFTCCGK